MALSDNLSSLVSEYDLPPEAVHQFDRLLLALAAEPDPHTTITDPVAAVDQHIADSLCALKIDGVRRAPSIVDIGAGAGFPGLPLAIALPTARVDLLESARRKVGVIERLAEAAGVANARAISMRAEEWGLSEGRDAYQLATARAVARLPVLVEYAAPLLTPGGMLIAWKGTRDAAEEESGRAAAEMVGLRTLDVTGVVPFAGARHLNLHLYLKERATPARFPRRPGVAAKRPLA
ncbi:MAG TPA: 16S rRNA (guanine(527)-N(7))-methyltransferase RsmG [Thermoleophilaceae bacterium]